MCSHVKNNFNNLNMFKNVLKRVADGPRKSCEPYVGERITVSPSLLDLSVDS